MLSPEGKIGKIVIKTGLVDSLPSGSAVAAAAGLPEFVLVRVTMAINALGKTDAAKLQVGTVIGIAIVHNTGMAFFTPDLVVFSG